jgi:hypothetical protein
MAAPYWIDGMAGSGTRPPVTAETSPNEAYRAGWRDCLIHVTNTFKQEIMICDDSGGAMLSADDEFVFRVINGWPDPYLS